MEENTTAIQGVGVDYSEKSLNEILTLFKEMLDRKDQQELYKKAEPVKAAFYKVLRKEKLASGVFVEIGQPAQTEGVTNPFEEVEKAFKELFEEYKALRADYTKEAKEKKEENYKQKLEIIEGINQLLEKAEDMNHTLPAFRELQAKWKSLGSVPPEKARELVDNYNRTLEKFYDYIKINKDFRDLDFRKNLQAKTELCEKAEALVQEKDVVAAFNALQKLHEEWKELGPVAKSERESIWERFKSATSVINKKYQGHFEQLKEQQKENLAAKTELCEKAEAIAENSAKDSKEWNSLTKQMDELQAKWKTIGFASKKENQKIYDRFRAACDKFYNTKREYYTSFKDVMLENLKKKEDLCAQAESLKDSTDWKKATDQFINLQRVWKQIGPVARKQSDAVWKRFRAACDEFFENKAKHFGTEDPKFEENLSAKKALIEKVKAYTPSSDIEEKKNVLNEFLTEWNQIGFVPMKEKAAVTKEFNDALNTHFEELRDKDSERRMGRLAKMIKDVKTTGKGDRTIRFEREKLLAKFRKLQGEISTLENNMGFFAKSKNADKLIAEIKVKIEENKKELSQIEQQIKSIDKEF